MISVLFVCLGNICRSPSAEAVFRKKVDDAQLSDKFHIDSAGTAGYHIGAGADTRAVEKGRLRGYDLSLIRARKVSIDDYTDFDYILAMDNQNFAYLKSHSPTLKSTATIRLMRNAANTALDAEVPDPYYGSEEGFDEVLDILEIAADELLNEIRVTDLGH